MRVELVWVKGHKSSAGNKRADRAAGRAARSQIGAADIGVTVEGKDVPVWMWELGGDYVDEWLYRENGGPLVGGAER